MMFIVKVDDGERRMYLTPEGAFSSEVKSAAEFRLRSTALKVAQTIGGTISGCSGRARPHMKLRTHWIKVQTS